MYDNTKSLVKNIMEMKIPKSNICLDMTLGNGNDSLNMLELNNSIKIYGFDIQKSCVDKIKALNIENIYAINDSHINFDKYVDSDIDFAIFNLGYLPGGDKSITTDYDTVIHTIEKLLCAIKIDALIVITFYPGHKSGLDESINVLEYLNTLDQKRYNVVKYEFVNQINNPPFVCVIERIK